MIVPREKFFSIRFEVCASGTGASSSFLHTVTLLISTPITGKVQSLTVSLFIFKPAENKLSLPLSRLSSHSRTPFRFRNCKIYGNFLFWPRALKRQNFWLVLHNLSDNSSENNLLSLFYQAVDSLEFVCIMKNFGWGTPGCYFTCTGRKDLTCDN